MALDGDGDWQAVGGSERPSEAVLVAAAAVLAELVPVGGCPGTMVVHLDGSPAACSEELDGRGCPGGDRPHLGAISCDELLGFGGCEACAPSIADDGWDDLAWRHAVRVGVLATRRHQCRHHRSAP